MQLDKNLQTGGLNTDDTDYLLPKGDAENRVNVRVIDTGSGDAGAVVNILGNVLVESSEYNTNGIDTVIGSIEDPELRRVIFFVSNTGGNHKILCYKYDTNTVVRVLANENFGSGQNLPPMDRETTQNLEKKKSLCMSTVKEKKIIFKENH
jgi:hypothetical protein